MASTHQGIDFIIRRITAEQAVEMTPQLWAQLKSLPPEDMLTQSKYVDLVCYTARCILAKIEKAGFNVETWKSYTDFFTQAIMAYGTADMPSYLRIAERLLSAVLGFPSGPQPLLKEYLNCAVAQNTQRSAELAAHLAKQPSGALPQRERQPDLEYDDNFVAVIKAKPVSEAMKILEKLPSQLTFAHRRAIMHLTLCNPLPIPGCAYVSTGYCCDTCHLRGIRVGFQAMLYDAEEGSSSSSTGFTSANVRSDAQISKKKTYGFDICIACAVTFYSQQRKSLLALLRFPHESYSFGHASGVRISQVRYHSRRRAVSPATSSSAFPLSREHSGTEAHLRSPQLSGSLPSQERRLSGQSAQSVSPCTSLSKLPAGDFGIHVGMSNSSSCGSSASSADGTAEKRATAKVSNQPPPVRPPIRTKNSGLHAPPPPPATRCATEDVMCITLNVTIAPYGARPVAWVLSHTEKLVELDTMEEVLRKDIGPSSQWRARVKAEAASAIRRRRVSAASSGSFAAQGSAPAIPRTVAAASHSLDAAPSMPTAALAGDSPRELLGTMPPSQTKVASQHAVLPRVSSSLASKEEEEMCAICLCPFESEEPVIETRCHHWFHVACIEEYARIAEDVCPLCRAECALPDMSLATTLKNNAYKIVVELTEEQRQLPYVDVCVGSVVTRDGNYHNATSIAAAQCVRVRPSQLRGFQVKSPIKALASLPLTTA